MRIYLASRYTRREELCEYRTQLEAAGHTVTSRWLNGDHQASDADMMGEQAAPAERERYALEDWQDLMAAECCISFTETPRGTTSRGGRHVEFGAALAAGQLCLVVGPRENVFHCLPSLFVFPDFATLMASSPFPSFNIYGEHASPATSLLRRVESLFGIWEAEGTLGRGSELYGDIVGFFAGLEGGTS